jgi:hypothetical protein
MSCPTLSSYFLLPSEGEKINFLYLVQTKLFEFLRYSYVGTYLSWAAAAEYLKFFNRDFLVFSSFDDVMFFFFLL